jgi:hypothetical protein
LTWFECFAKIYWQITVHFEGTSMMQPFVLHVNTVQ